MSVGCSVPEAERPPAFAGAAPGRAGRRRWPRQTGLTQLLAESTTSSVAPSGSTAMAAGSAMPNLSKPVAGRVAPVAVVDGQHPAAVVGSPLADHVDGGAVGGHHDAVG